MKQTHKSSGLDEEISKYDKATGPGKQLQIEWWFDNQNEFHLLHKIAMAFITSPVTEVSVERLFSHLKQLSQNIDLDSYR